jgi:formin-binding protein 1
MFAQHNKAQWNEPADFAFEPSPIWHDDPEIITDEYAKVFLRNLVSKSREGLSKIQGNVTLKQQEVGKLRSNLQSSKDQESSISVSPVLEETNSSNSSM